MRASATRSPSSIWPPGAVPRHRPRTSQRAGTCPPAFALLGDHAWSAEYDLTLALQSALGEASYLSGALESADRATDDVVRHARTALDAFTARDTRVMVAYARDRQDLVLEHGLEALRELGVRFPQSPNMASIVVDLARTKFALRGRVIESLADLPAMTDARMIAAMQMIERMIPAAFRSGSKLFPLLVFRLVRLSVRHGNSPVSAFGYSTYAISLCGVLGDYDGGYRFSLVGQRVAERFNAPAFRSKALFVFGNFVRHWREPLAESIEPLAQSWRLGMESGAQFEAIWATFYRLLWLLQSGRDLPEVEGEIIAMEGLLAQDAGVGRRRPTAAPGGGESRREGRLGFGERRCGWPARTTTKRRCRRGTPRPPTRRTSASITRSSCSSPSGSAPSTRRDIMPTKPNGGSRR